MKLCKTLGLSSLALLTLNSPQLLADDSFEFNGYFRAGTVYNTDGGTSSNAQCFSLAHPKNDGLYYRLGNECRDYGEVTLNKKGKADKLEYTASFMLDFAGDNSNSTGTQGFSRRERAAFIQFDNLFENGAEVWVGRRYYRAVAVGDVHIIDAFHVNSSGNGFGVTNIPFGKENKAHVAVLQQGDSDNSQLVLDARAEFGLGDAGALKVALQHLTNNEPKGAADATDGTTYTLQWEKNLGGIFDQKTVVQLGTDAAANNPGCFGSDGIGNGNCFDTSEAADGREGLRLFNNGTWNFTERLKVNTMVMFEDIDETREVTSIGIRPHYGLSKHWSILGEIGINDVKPEGGSSEKLTKYTLALQASTDGNNFWSRPSLRFFVSSFNWNDAARDGASKLRNIGDPSKTDALLVGAHAEIWF